MKKKQLNRMLATVLCASMVASNGMILSAAPAAKAGENNLALNKPITTSYEYPGMGANLAVDGNGDTRWATEPKGTNQWVRVDLGSESEIREFRIFAENDGAQRIGQFKIEGSNDDSTYTEIYQSEDKSAEGFAQDTIVTLDEAVNYRYVKLTIQKLMTGAYPSISLREFEVRGIPGEEAQDPKENVALGKKAVASSEEAASVKASNAVDGDTTSKSSRWGSGTNGAPHWIYVDLGKTMDVRTVRLFWEQRKPTAYRIQIADTLSDPMADTDWTDVKVVDGRPASKNEEFVFDEVKKARYVRLYIDSATSEDPDGGVTWNAVSIYEMEVYGGTLGEMVTIDTVLDKIKVTQPTAETTKLEVTLPKYEGYKVEYNGTDYEQVIGENLEIYKPVVDTTVKASFKVTDEKTGDYKFKEIDVTVPGQYTKEETDNAVPVILPELREWKGTEGTFAFADSSKIVVPSELEEMANVFAADYKDLTGKTLEVDVNGTAQAGDVVFTLTDDKSKGLQDEGYLMTIEDDKITVEAETNTGAFWATRTILQSIKLTGNVPCGITRDYPLYKVRGFILDVGRKTFTLDYLQQFVKEMAWYKMNDFQVHLNDNLIPLEDYSRMGKDPMQAYSAFRLESDIKEGGNDGKNKADLTSKDVFYTKAEFKKFIEDSRVQGVNIVPEIDTPAHSLALTKVRPDLRHGTYGRDNDHLALATKYDECVEFVKSIFDEYMMGDDPVFDDQTIVHVGADEYNANKEAYRRFSDDMLKYVQDTGRTARIWGSLSQCRGETPVRSKDVQMNLWNFGYANMDEMYELGYDLINCNDGNYYIVPAAGYYYDYLYAGTMYNLPINSIGGVTIPAGDKQMVGGAFAVWNDMTDYLENGMSEYDIYDRSAQHMELFASKLWGKGELDIDAAQAQGDKLGDAPNTNFKYEVEDQDGVILHETFDEAVNVDGKTALELKGGESYVTTDVKTAGLGNDLRVKVKRTSDSTEEQILFESSYGSIKAVQKETGKVGFSRERHDYSFDYTLPVNEWVELEFKNVKDVVKLYVNGVLVDTLGDNDKTSNEMADLTGNYKALHATTMFPMERIGSKTNAFKGYVDDVRLGKNAEFNSTMELDYAAVIANTLLADMENEELAALAERAETVLAKFAPTAEEVKELADQMNAIIAAADYEKADYSEVEAYRALIPEDLSVFTADSVAVLNRVLDSIRPNLPAAMQSTVDGYAVLLADALHSLEVKTEANVNYVDNATLKATASTNQGGEGPEKAIDGNLSTMWHSRWDLAQMPHWIDLEMQEPTAVKALTYIPRQSGSNGNLTKYKVQISDDGVNYTDIKEGTLPNNNAAKVIEFEEVTTKHVRLYYVEAAGNFGSAAELKLHLANVAPDLEGLNKVIAEAEAIENAGFTEDSWNALQAKIAEAKELAGAEAPNANDVEIMKRELSHSMVSLVLEKQAEQPAEYVVTVDGKEAARGAYNTPVTVTAPDAPKGQVFAGWKVKDEIVSFDQVYTFYISNNVDLIPTYAVSAEEVPKTVLTNAFAMRRKADEKSDIRFVGQLVVPKGYTVKNAGLIWSSTSDKELIVDNALNSDLKPTYIKAIGDTDQFSVTIKGVPSGRFVRGRIFATLTDATGKEVLVYSEEKQVNAFR